MQVLAVRVRDVIRIGDDLRVAIVGNIDGYLYFRLTVLNAEHGHCAGRCVRSADPQGDLTRRMFWLCSGERFAVGEITVHVSVPKYPAPHVMCLREIQLGIEAPIATQIIRECVDEVRMASLRDSTLAPSLGDGTC